jgi:arylsulfatase A-like enzyme
MQVRRYLGVRASVSVAVAFYLVVALLGASAGGSQGTLDDVTSAHVAGGSAGRAATVSVSHAAPTRADARPNIILITTDDQTLADLSVMTHVRQQLGGRGTTFANAYSPYPLCCPARATLLTGQYAHNHGVQGNFPPYGGFALFDDTNALPVWLQQSGYRTAILGKYLNGYAAAGLEGYVPPGWDTWRVPVQGTYNYRSWTLNVDGEQVAYRGRYQTDFVATEAKAIVQRYAPQRNPYFLWAGFLAPHAGAPRELDDPARLVTPNVSPRYRDVYAQLPLPAKASINESDVSDKPHFVQDSPIRSVRGMRELTQQRLESLLSVDDAVAELIDTVEATGELDNTVIIFTSDNGFLIGEHRRIGKDVAYQEATRVPLIIAGPGFDTGQIGHQLVSLVDIPRTIAALARAPAARTQDGIGLRRVANNATFAAKRPILLEGGPTGSRPNQWYAGIQTKRYVYVEYDGTKEKELYDLVRDPLQLENLAVTAPRSAAQIRLAAALDTLRTCAGSTCQQPVGALAR